jgi:hypothetical protein
MDVKKLFLNISFQYLSIVVNKNDRSPKLTRIYSDEIPIPLYSMKDEEDFPLVAKVKIEGGNNNINNEYRLFDNKYLMRKLLDIDIPISPINFKNINVKNKEERRREELISFIEDGFQSLKSFPNKTDKIIYNNEVKNITDQDEIDEIIRKNNYNNMIKNIKQKTEKEYVEDYKKRNPFFVSYKSEIYIITNAPSFVLYMNKKDSKLRMQDLYYLKDYNEGLPDYYQRFNRNFIPIQDNNKWIENLSSLNNSEISMLGEDFNGGKKRFIFSIKQISDFLDNNSPLTDYIHYQKDDPLRIKIEINENHKDYLHLPYDAININTFISKLISLEAPLLNGFLYHSPEIYNSYIDLLGEIQKNGYQDNLNSDFIKNFENHIHLISNFLDEIGDNIKNITFEESEQNNYKNILGEKFSKENLSHFIEYFHSVKTMMPILEYNRNEDFNNEYDNIKYKF